ncbi:ribonuclease P protein subunit [Candidatus Woesearchaeota archaeon]|nr:MAG: ribonuclease P protein subunit [Candidatus Woesearchaeota archaeon]
MRRDLLRGELIGRALEVVQSPNKAEVGLKGRVVDETFHTFVIEEGSHQKRVAKARRVFRIDGEVVRGDAIHYRPQDRVKRARK